MIDTVLFDLDGTLIDSNGLIIETFKHVFETELPHIKMTEADYIKFIGPTLYQGFSKYISDPEQIDYLIKAYRAYNLKVHDEKIHAFDGAVTLLKTLTEKGYKVGVVSSKMHYLIERGLKVTSLFPYVDFIIGSDECINHKPHPEPVLKAVEALNAKEAIYVGDHPNDILAGKGANLKTVGMSYSLHLESLKASNPDYIVDRLIDILEVI